ncbi:MAG: DNA-binding response regulator, LuxR family [Anaerolineae bacterium]|jgi:DNA-binding NarL/FixJ family response regulator|nr:MAG: DNA-binding response regulator, LuxR family [Anaerolineae bacterium]
MIRVFLADDHTLVRDGLKFILETEADIRVIGAAGDGKTAVQECLRQKPDVILMDIAMPTINGIEATAQILRQEPSLKVIILSMHETRQHILNALKAGANGYLLKESAGEEVIQAVRAVVQGRRYLSQRIAERILDDYLFLQEMVEQKDPLEKLSERERQVLKLVVEGKSNLEIAQTLFLSIKTVETYRSRIMAKLEINDLPTLVKFAIQHGLISLDE